MTAGRNAGPAASRDAVPFLTDHEGGCHTLPDGSPPALVINPAANTAALLRAIGSRADRLQREMMCWTIVPEGDATVADVASLLEPIAQEIDLLAQEALARIHRDGRPS